MAADPPKRFRIALIVADSVRTQGLHSLFEPFAELLPMTPTEAVRDQSVSMVIVEASDTVFALLAAFRRARAGLRLLVLGDNTDPKYIGRIVASGAKAYLSHQASSREIETAVAVVADGSIWAPRKVLASLIETYSPDEPRRREIVFTDRERQILRLLIDGKPDREIAAVLEISPRTVQSSVGRMLKKTGVENRVALTVHVLAKHLL